MAKVTKVRTKTLESLRSFSITLLNKIRKPNNLLGKSKSKHVNLISLREDILTTWINSTITKSILDNHSLELSKFNNQYSYDMYEHFISKNTKKETIKTIKTFLLFFVEKDISLNNLFEIYIDLKNIIFNFTYDNKLNSKQLFNELSHNFDNNLREILNYYTNIIYKKEEDTNRNQKLLSEYKKALDASALIFKINLSGDITYVNDRLIKLSGYKSQELVGQKLNHIVDQDISTHRIENIYKELNKNDIYNGTIKAFKKNREHFYADITIIKINDTRYRDSEYMVIANDVTKLIDAKIEALKAVKAKDYFLSNMSHEIRTPLNAILGFVNLLIDENVSKKHRNYLNIILNSGENLLSIISDILDLAKLRSGEFRIEPIIFSIHDELSHVMELFVASANAKNITITSFIDPGIPQELYADALRINQILSNFLSNAIKFTQNNGVINIEATCKNNKLTLSVKDNGIGIDKKDKEKIFSAFTQSIETDFKNIGGTGLGLSISHQLVERMNGDIKVESTLGEGSKFSVTIPVKYDNEQCKLYDDIKEFQDLKIVLYIKDKEVLFGHKSFLRYAKSFNMNVTIADNFNTDFDVALFIHEDINDDLKKQIIKSNKKYIALMSKNYDDYNSYSNITSLCFPIYCSKLHATFSELLNTTSSYLYTHNNIQIFKGHILIVEDNEANQELIKAILIKYGLNFDLAKNGLEALRLYKLHKYDLVLMDEQMPVMNGLEAVKEIRAYEINNSLIYTPIAIISANVIRNDTSTQHSYDAFLAKPIVLKDLENIFTRFLKIKKINITKKTLDDKSSAVLIEGFDSEKLRKELMLSKKELVELLTLFISKMSKTLPNLKNAIKDKDYEKIALISHSIKGSSSNFRIELLDRLSTEMENMANDKNDKYNYIETFNKIDENLKKIKIKIN